MDEYRLDLSRIGRAIQEHGASVQDMYSEIQDFPWDSKSSKGNTGRTCEQQSLSPATQRHSAPYTIPISLPKLICTEYTWLVDCEGKQYARTSMKMLLVSMLFICIMITCPPWLKLHAQSDLYALTLWWSKVLSLESMRYSLMHSRLNPSGTSDRLRHHSPPILLSLPRDIIIYCCFVLES